MSLWPSRYNVVFPLSGLDGQRMYVLQNLFYGQADFVTWPVARHFSAGSESDQNADFQCDDVDASVIERLVGEGFLYRSRDEEEAVIQMYQDVAGQRDAIIAQQRGSQYGFLPTFACNLRCPYCFQRKLQNKNQMMTVDMVDRAFAAIDELENDIRRRQSTVAGAGLPPGVSIAGGEPLLDVPRQRRVLERIIECSEAREFRYSITTNGVELHKFVDLFDRTARITDIQVTVDGPQIIHNRRRIHADGRDTFAAIERGVNTALEKRLPISMRVNIDGSNIDAIPQLGAYILSSGWLDAPNFHCYVSPVTDNQDLRDYSGIGDEGYLLDQMLEFFAHDPRLERVFDIKHFRGFDYVRNLIKQLEPKPPVLFRCEAVLGMYIFDPFGQVYVCLEASGNRHLSVGSYSPRFQIHADKLQEWFTKDLVNLPHCANCKVRFICAGGCALKAFNDSSTPDCKPILHEMAAAWNYFRDDVAALILQADTRG